MGYRDELEALRAKNKQLEAELAVARREIEGDRARQNRDEASILAGGPIRITRELELDAELDESGLELLVDELRREVGEVGRTEQLGQTLTWATTQQGGRIVEVSCVRRKGRTRITIRENLRQLVGGLFGGGLGGGGGGGMAFVIPMAMRVPGLLPVFILGWFLLCYAVVRSIFRRLSRRRAAKLDELTLRLGQQLRREIQDTTAAGLRVDDQQASAEAELQTEAEQQAEEAAVSSRRRARR